MTNMSISKITSAGQISIPKDLRESRGLEASDYVSIEPLGEGLYLRKVKSFKEDIFDYFQTEAKRKGISKEDVDKAIDEVGNKLFREKYSAIAKE